MWRKIFYNPLNTGTTSIEEPASWSRTPLDCMYGCDLIEQNKTLSIRGYGNYWQSDTFISVLRRSQIVKRRIEKQIDQPYGFILLNTNILKVTFLKEEYDIPNLDFTKQLNQWLILELDLVSGQKHWYISKDKI